MQRYCTNCGNLTIKQNDNLYLCEQGHENWINPAVAAITYVISAGAVLFGVRSIDPNKGKLCLPGGFIEVHESAEAAAIREVKEEMGIDVTIQTCLGSYADMYNGRPTLNIVFIATTTDQKLTAGDDMSGGEPVWRQLDDLPTLDETAWKWYQAAQKDLLEWWQARNNAPLAL